MARKRVFAEQANTHNMDRYTQETKVSKQQRESSMCSYNIYSPEVGYSVFACMEFSEVWSAPGYSSHLDIAMAPTECLN